MELPSDRSRRTQCFIRVENGVNLGIRRQLGKVSQLATLGSGNIPVGMMLLRLLGGSAGLRIGGMFFGFLVGVQLARGLGPAGYGVYGTAMAVVAILMLPTEFGLPLLITREVAATSNAGAGAYVTRLIIHWARNRVITSSVIIALAVIIALVTGLIKVDLQLRAAIYIGLMWIPIVALGNIYGATLRGLHRVIAGQLGEFLVRPAIMSLLLFLLVFFTASRLTPTSAMALNVTAAAMAAGIAAFLLRRELGRRSSRVEGGLPDGLAFKQALPMAMSEGLRVLASQVGILILASAATHSEVGQYRVAYQVYSISTMPSALVNIACAPMIASLFSQGRLSELVRLNILISFFLILSSATVLIAYLAIGAQAVRHVFGNGYSAAADLLAIFLVGELISSLFGHPVVLLNMTRQSRVVMLWSAVSLVVTAASIAMLIPYFGVTGAVVGTSIGLISWNFGCAFHAKWKCGIDTSMLTLWLKPTQSVAQ